MEVFKLRGKIFSNSEIEIIKSVVEKYFDKGRTFISKQICEEINWKQPNGWLKDRACRDVLNELNRLDILKLPEPIIKKTSKLIPQKEIVFEFDSFDEISINIELKFAKGNSLEPVWNSLIKQFHYLGHSVLVGKCIKYLIYCNDVLIGAISFSSPVKNVNA